MIKRQFETLKGTRQWGYIHLPADKTQKYPLVFFCHGSGENGNSEAEVTKLLKYSPLGFINTGWNPDIIVMGVQHHSWSFPADRIVYLLNNDPDIKANWNGKAMITGLSAGGEIVINFMRGYHNPDKFVYVPMSPSGSAWGLTAPAYKVWGFVGDSDTTTRGAISTLTDIRNRFGGKLTIYQGGHGGWERYYNPAYKEDGKNIYEWAFGETVIVPPVIPPPVIPEKTVKTKWEFILYSDGSVDCHEML